MDRKRIACAALALLAPAAGAQDLNQDWGVWTNFAGQGHFSGDEGARWRGWFDAHARFLDDSDGFEQSIVRPGVGYDVTQDATLWAGYAWIHTDPAAGESFDEHRIWQQFTWSAPLGANAFLSRSRLEQRFLDTGDDVGWRFRQFLRLVHPFSDGSSWAVRVWDELFFNLNDTDWGADAGFSQNRLFLGLGWTFGAARDWTLEFGYLNQFIPRSGRADRMNHILSVQWILSW